MTLRDANGMLTAASGVEAQRIPPVAPSLAALIAGLGCVWGMQTGAQPTAVSGKFLEPITVTARKEAVPKTDEEVTRQVEAALRADPYVFDSHVRITTKDGVVTLSGMVLDVWDVFTLKRIVRKMAGVKKVIDQLDLEVGGD